MKFLRAKRNQSLILSLSQIVLVGLSLSSFLLLVSCTGSTGKGVSSAMTPQTPTAPAPPSSSQASGEGGWESSGGGGIACFKDEGIAKKAQAELETDGFLSSDLRSQIQSAMTLESWEYFRDPSRIKSNFRVTSLTDFAKATGFNPDHSLQKLESEKVFKKVLNSLSRFLPLLSQRMEMVSEHVPLSKWKGSQRVPIVQDADPTRPLAKNCVRIQIANRYSRSHIDKLPEVEIHYDEEIFNKFLTEFDKALLMSHEYLYVVGREGNHKNSNVIRRYNAFLFSIQAFYPGQLMIPFSYQTKLMREIADYPFGDYMRFFKRELPLSAEVKVGTQASRYQSIIAVMEFLRKDMSECLTKENYKDLRSSNEQWSIRFKCQKQTIEENPALLSKLTDEQAFIFLGRFFFDNISNDFNSEQLASLTAKSQELLTAEQEKQAQYYCRNIDKVSGTKFEDLKNRAQKYCKDDLGISPEAPNQAPFRREFSCFSPGHLLIWHNGKDQDNTLTIAIDMNKETGAVYSPPFKGLRTLKSSNFLSVVRDLGFGNQETSTQDTYELSPANEEDQKLLRGLVEREPKTFASAEVYVGKKQLFIKTAEEFKKLLLITGSSLIIIKMNVILDCSVVHTNLPAEDWYYQ